MAEPGEFLETFDEGERSILSTLRFAVCVGRFYEDLAQRLLRGADEGFELAGVRSASVRHASVPGAYELPFAAKLHAEAARGIQDVQLATGVPCAFGVITCDTMEQALERAGGGKRDQGRNAALTVARMALLQRQLA